MAKKWSEVAGSPEFLRLSSDEQEQVRSSYFDRAIAPRIPEGEREAARGEFDRLTRKAPGQARSEFEPPETPASSGMSEVVSDIGTGLAIGARRAVEGLGELVTQSRIPAVRGLTIAADVINARHGLPSMEEQRKRSARELRDMEEGYTPETRAAGRKLWWDEERSTFGDAWSDPRAYMKGLTESLPEQVLTMAPAMRLAKGAYTAKLAAGATEEVAAKAASRAAWIAGGLGEGALAGAATAREVREQIDAMSDEDLRGSDAIKALLKGGMTLEDAKRAIAEDASTKGFLLAAFTTGAFSGLGDKALAKAIFGGKDKLLARTIKGMVSEGLLEEFPQSYLEKVAENVAMRDVDPNRSLTGGALNEAFGGLAIGGVQGGAQSAIFGRSRPPAAAGLAGPVDASEALEEPTAAPEQRNAEMAFTPSRGMTDTQNMRNAPPEITQDDAGKIDTQLQNRDRDRAVSVAQMAEIASAPDFDRLAEAPIADVGAPMVSAKNDAAIEGAVFGKKSNVTLPDGTKVPVQYAVIEADQALASHSVDGTRNDRYFTEPQAGEVRALTNGRVAGLQEAYVRNTARDYAVKLAERAEEFGLDREAIAAKRTPMLVRIYPDAINKLPGLGRMSNTGGSARLSPLETAVNDSEAVRSLDALEFADNGDINIPSNRQFFRAFVQQVVPKQEWPEVMDDAGRLNAAGLARIRNAVMVKAFGKSPSVLRVLDSADDNVRRITQGLMRIAPRVARAREAAAAGQIFPIDVIDDVLAAAEEMSRIRAEGKTIAQVLAQMTLVERPYSDETVEILSFLDDANRSGSRLVQFINAYLDELEKYGPQGEDMFGAKPVPEKGPLTRGKIKEVLDEEGRVQGSAAGGAARVAAEPKAGETGRGAKEAPGDGEPGRPAGGKQVPAGQGAERGAERDRPDVKAEPASPPKRKSEGKKKPPAASGMPKAGTNVPETSMPAAPTEKPKREFGRGVYNPEHPSREKPTSEKKDTRDIVQWWDKELTAEGRRKVLLVVTGKYDGRPGLEAHVKTKYLNLREDVQDAVRSVQGTPNDPQVAEKAAPPAEPKKLTAEEQAREDLQKALGDLGDIIGKPGRKSITPEQEQKLLPVMTRLFDAAFRMGFHKFKAAAKFVRAEIRKALGAEVEDLLTIEHYQGAYIGMAGRYRDTADKAVDVAAITDKAEFSGEAPAFKFDDMQAAARGEPKKKKAKDVSLPADIMRGIEEANKEARAAGIEFRPTDWTRGVGYWDLADDDMIGWDQAKHVNAEWFRRVIDEQKEFRAGEAEEFPEGWEAFREDDDTFTLVGPDGERVMGFPSRRTAAEDARERTDPETGRADRIEQANTRNDIEKEMAAAARPPERPFAAGDKVQFRGSPNKQVYEVWMVSEDGHRIKIHEPAPKVWRSVVDFQRADDTAAAPTKAEAKQAAVDAAANQAATSPTNKLPHPTTPQAKAGNYKKGKIPPELIHGFNINIENPAGSWRHGYDTDEIKSLADAAKEYPLTEARRHNLIEAWQMFRSGDIPAGVQLLELAAKNSVRVGPAGIAESAKIRKIIADGWHVQMPAGVHYGEFARTEGADGDPVDVFVGDPNVKRAFIINQRRPLDADSMPNDPAAEFDEHKVMLGFMRGDDAAKAYFDSFAGDFGRRVFQSISPGLTLDELRAQLPALKKAKPVQAARVQPSGDGGKITKQEAQNGQDGLSGVQGRAPARDSQGDLFAAPTGAADSRPVVPGREGKDAGAREGRDADRPAEGSVPAGEPSAGGERRPGLQPPGGPREASDLRPAARPVAKTQAVFPPANYTITAADKLGVGGAKQKFRDNLAAIRLVKQLEIEERRATPDEQKVLVRYVGWGGLKEAFDPDNDDWRTEREELAGALNKDELDAARRSVQDAHYTSETVIRGLYEGLDRLGVKGNARILEPSVGVGHFFGLMPENLRGGATLFGVELDPTSAAIARHLYQKAEVTNRGFQDVPVPAGYFDLAIGNPPFGEQRMTDTSDKTLSGKTIHNYFFAKSMKALRPGGILAMVVSRYYMDKANPMDREDMAAQAYFLGGVRLPNTAFKQNARTEVTTDILFFEKAGAHPGGKGFRLWTDTGDVRDPETGNGIRVNRYFAENPKQMLGTMTLTGSMYGANEPTLEPRKGQDLAAGITEALKQLPENVYKEIPDEQRVSFQYDGEGVVPDDAKIDSYFVLSDGTIGRRMSDQLSYKRFEKIEAEGRTAERIKGMVGIRESLSALMAAELSEDVSEQRLAARREHLNRTYDSFRRKFGYLNDRANRLAFRDDPALPLLESLEPKYQPAISKEVAARTDTTAREATAEKADIFKRRVLAPWKPPTKASTAKEALLHSLNMRGAVDLDYMGELYGKDRDVIAQELSGVIYLNPEGGWETQEQYLSGNVKAKLAQARAAMEKDRKFEENVAALEKVIPADIEALDINVSLGSPWVPTEDMKAFVKHLLGAEPREFKFLPQVGSWAISIPRGVGEAYTATWGTKRMPADDVIGHLANGEAVVVYDTIEQDGKEKRIKNDKETEAAQVKADEVGRAFKEWIWTDADRRVRLARLYNDTYNTNRTREHDGSHLTFPGMSPAVSLRKHQKGVVWRILQDRTVLLDHVVGAGKTFAVAAGVMEAKRIGIAKKQMLVVPNHLVRQWKDEFYRLYPNANILVPSEKDFERKNRQRLFARIATNDWDAVIVAHSSFLKIEPPKEAARNILAEQINDIEQAVKEMKAAKGENRNAVRQLEKMKERLDNKMKLLATKGGARDQVVDLEQMGVDGIDIDEMHEFKNLFYHTKMQRVAGLGTPMGSGKAFDLFVKMRFLAQRFGGKAPQVTATGTPVSNSLVEMFTMQRYMMYDELKRRSIHHLDSWAKVFGSVANVYEVHPSGQGYRLSTRFAKFVNLPELMTLYKSFADVITMKDLKAQSEAEGKRFPVPNVKGGKPQNVVAERSLQQVKFFGEEEPQFNDDGSPKLNGEGAQQTAWTPGSILARIENLKNVKDPREDNMLKITNDARKAGLDFRLIDPGAADFPGSKQNLLKGHVKRIYEQWAGDRGTQLIFCDLSIPSSARGKEAEKFAIRTISGVRIVRGRRVSLAGAPEELEFILEKVLKPGSRTALLGYRVIELHTGREVAGADKAADALAAAAKALEDKAALQELISDAVAAEEVSADEAEQDAEAPAGEDEEDAVGIDELMAQSSSFSVYDDVKAKLVAAGIPAEEVAFIHDFDTSEKKKKLFAQMNAGTIRVLLGSTFKMGAGMNVQERLVALHHLDAPWRPSDLEQREGRIIRQGNKLYERNPDGFEVEVMRYATNQTYDTRMWQLIEHKAAGVEQLRKGDNNLREIEDISGEAANASEMKAAASGNPLILEEVTLRTEVKRLEAEEYSHKRTKHTRQDRISMLTSHIGHFDRRMGRIRALRAAVAPKEPFAYRSPDGKEAKEKKDAGGALIGAIASAIKSDGHNNYSMGVYRGVFLYAKRGFASVGIEAQVKGVEGSFDVTSYQKDEQFSAAGFFTRVDNWIDGLEEREGAVTAEHERNQKELEGIRSRLDEPFAKAAELAEKRQRHQQITQALKAGKKTLDAPKPEEGKLSTGGEAGSTIDKVREEIRTEIGEKAAKVEVVQSWKDLPEKGRRLVFSRRAFDVQGWFDQESGRFVLVADNIKPGRAFAVLMHEVGVHMGLKGFIGAAAFDKLAAQITEWAAFGIGEHGKLAKAALARIPKNTPKKDRMEELVAYFVEESVKAGHSWHKPTNAVGRWFADLMRAIATALQKLGLRPSAITVDEVVALARGALEVALSNYEGRRGKDGLLSVVWHGSPHDFDEFKLNKINTGEGAQAFGWGLYFAGNKAVAEYYRDELAPANVSMRRLIFKKTELVKNRRADQEAVKAAFPHLNAWDLGLMTSALENVARAGDVDTEIERIESFLPLVKSKEEREIYERSVELTRSLRGKVTVEAGKGRLYEVNLAPDEDEYLLWDQLLSKQPRVVEKLAGGKHRVLAEGLTADWTGKKLYFELAKALHTGPKQDDGWNMIVNTMNDQLVSMEEASKYLLSLGVPGLKYEDAGSRGTRTKSYNYVVFDDSLATISAKFSQDGGGLFSRSGEDTAPPRRRFRPLDAATRIPLQALRVDKATGWVYDKLIEKVGGFIPEKFKAGVVADYGLPEAVIDRRDLMFGHQRAGLRRVQNLLDKFATLTRAEARVLHQAATTADPAMVEALLDGLPEESKATLREVKAWVHEMGEEEVRLGQLSRESFERNEWAYLHRSYEKYEVALTPQEKAARGRAVRLWADSYKGRGIEDAEGVARLRKANDAWWGRKLDKTRPDFGMAGQKFLRLELRANRGDGVMVLPGVEETEQRGRLRDVVYWPADEALPDRFKSWDQDGTRWEARVNRKGRLVMWRDFTPEERQSMGEIDDIRYAMAKTLHLATHNVEVGRYLEWLANAHAMPGDRMPAGAVKRDAREQLHVVFGKDEWVKVPEVDLAGTGTKKYGKLAGLFVPGPVWNDIRHVTGHRYAPLGETYASLLKAWKISKTALSPTVHMNNVMANFVMADWHDIGAGDALRALRTMLAAARGDAEATATIARFEDAGGTQGLYLLSEIQRDQLAPILEEIELRMRDAGEINAMVGISAAVQLMATGQWRAALEAAKEALPVRATAKAARAMMDLYEGEDRVFRLAAFLRALEDGKTDAEAGKLARKSFLDYQINAPWINMMRSTAFPFISFVYRALPMVAETAARKPWKLLKLGIVLGVANALGYAISGGDEDEERRLLPEEKAGKVLGFLGPKLIRMPWNDEHDSPVFLDIRRWIPVGDIIDVGQVHSALPILPAMMPGGPLALVGEFLFNRSAFTGRPLVKDTDTGPEAAGKVFAHLWRSMAPNLAGIPYVPATDGIVNAGTGETDAFGRELSLRDALLSAIGIKVGSYPPDVAVRNARIGTTRELSEIRGNELRTRERQRRGDISESEMNKLLEQEADKRKRVQEAYRRKVGQGLPSD